MAYVGIHILLLLAFASTILSQCVRTNKQLAISALPSPYVITFDDLGIQTGWTSSPGVALGISYTQSVNLFEQGGNGYPVCFITTVANSYGVQWNGGDNWYGSATDRPGFFLAGGPGICTLQFNPPISAFVARMNSGNNPTNPWFTIYDAQSHPLDCQYIPNVPVHNAYAIVGFSSKTPITYLNFQTTNYGYYADNIQFLTCPAQGSWFNGTECVDIDECEDNPCSEHASCTNTIGSYSCSCNEGYEMSNMTCVDKCVTQSPCSSFATCTNNNGSLSCACNNGYQGDGVGPNGCQLIQSPSSSQSPSGNNQSPSSTSSPDGSNTNQPSSSANQPSSSSNQPSSNNSNNPSSSIVSSAHLIRSVVAAMNAMILSVLMLM